MWNQLGGKTSPPKKYFLPSLQQRKEKKRNNQSSAKCVHPVSWRFFLSPESEKLTFHNFSFVCKKHGKRGEGGGGASENLLGIKIKRRFSWSTDKYLLSRQDDRCENLSAEVSDGAKFQQHTVSCEKQSPPRTNNYFWKTGKLKSRVIMNCNIIRW